MRVADIIQAFPFLILIIAIVAVLGIGLTSVYIAVALVAWVSYARLIRGEILVAKNQEYVEAARSLGGSDGRVIVPSPPAECHHLRARLRHDRRRALHRPGDEPQLPRTRRAAAEPGVGRHDHRGRTFMATAWWISLFPGLAVVVTGIAFSVFGDGLADALRVRRR